MLAQDVIIVGGRPAGASLAIRLGSAGLRVRLLERATLPSLPAVSSPIIYSSAMRLLDELGADEAVYARDTPKIRRWVMQYRDRVRAEHPVPPHLGRDYAYAVDRERFDAHLWDLAARTPGVDALTGVDVQSLVRDGDAVVGVRARGPRGPLELRAGLVVGADGRFSRVAREAGARPRDADDARPTTLYYGYFDGAAPLDDDGPAAHVYLGRPGLGFLSMDAADGTLCVILEARADLLHGPPGPLFFAALEAEPVLWARLAHARLRGELRGIKNVGNLYRDPGGPGWALVGDALHQTDPIDGQGMYDALFTARALAEAVVAWRGGVRSWTEALVCYDAAVRRETLPMYRATLARVRRDLYLELPEWLRVWLGRWVHDNPEFKRRLGLLTVRALAPDRLLTPTLVPAVLGQGLARALRRGAAHLRPALRRGG